MQVFNGFINDWRHVKHDTLSSFPYVFRVYDIENIQDYKLIVETENFHIHNDEFLYEGEPVDGTTWKHFAVLCPKALDISTIITDIENRNEASGWKVPNWQKPTRSSSTEQR